LLPNLILQRTQLLPGKSPVSEYAKPQFKIFSESRKVRNFLSNYTSGGQTVRQKKSPNVTAYAIGHKIEKIKKRTQENKNL